MFRIRCLLSFDCRISRRTPFSSHGQCRRLDAFRCIFCLIQTHGHINDNVTSNGSLFWFILPIYSHRLSNHSHKHFPYMFFFFIVWYVLNGIYRWLSLHSKFQFRKITRFPYTNNFHRNWTCYVRQQVYRQRWFFVRVAGNFVHTLCESQIWVTFKFMSGWLGPFVYIGFLA